MRKVIDYKVVFKASEREDGKEKFTYTWNFVHDELEKEVKSLIAAGWEPIGGAVYTYQDGATHPLLVTQAMVKYEEITTY